jgi:GWxTD domain-containing protein
MLFGLAYNIVVKRIILLAVIWFAFFLPNLPLSGQPVKSVKDLPEKYKKWLAEEVVYIITPKEKEVFLRLENDRERELFIEAFWKQRDPNPNTPENEFKKEHFRRVSYANQWLGRDTPGAGWRTPMGRIYIILGEPNSIDKFENLTEIFPIIIWFYDGKVEYGLPNAFNVVFFKREGAGDWALYSPIKDGPESLLINYKGDMTNHLAAYTELMQIEPTIASISMTLIPGESQTTASPSIASEVLIQAKIPAAPREKVKDAYAEKFYKYKDSVGIEYTANYIDNDFAVHVIRDRSGMSFVHFLIEPKKLSLERDKNRFYTTLQVNAIVTDPKGIPVYQYEKDVPIELSEDQVTKIKNKLFSFQDLFPLIEGTYKLNLLLKNMISKEFTSAETQLTVPPASSLEISPLVLANRINENSEYKGKNKPYLVQEVQLTPSPRNDFASKDTLYLFFQVQGLTGELKAGGRLQFTIADDQKTVYTASKEIRAYPKVPDFFESIPLAELPPSLYKIKVALLDANGREAFSRETEFFVSLASVLPRPFIMSLPMPPSDDPMYDNIIGNQYLNRKDFREAGPRLEKAYRSKPASLSYAMDYGKWLYATGDHESVRRIGDAFLKLQKYEFTGLLGQSAEAMGDYEAAVAYYLDYMGHFGTNINVMNSIGDCYLKLGRNEDALKIWEKSLQLSPNQDRVRKLVQAIKEKK